jgi:amicyanin
MLSRLIRVMMHMLLMGSLVLLPAFRGKDSLDPAPGAGRERGRDRHHHARQGRRHARAPGVEGEKRSSGGKGTVGTDSGGGVATANAPAGGVSGATVGSEAKQISISNFKYIPATLTVPAGTKVTWTNQDDMPHTVTSTVKPRALDSEALDTDARFSYVFTEPGTYDYLCTIHPKMAGRVIVEKR